MPVGQGYRIKKEGKQKNKMVTPVQYTYGEVDPKLQYNIPKGVADDKKIKPKDVFEGYKDPLAKRKTYTRKNTSSNKKKKASNKR